MSERSRVATRLALLARAAAKRERLVDARVMIAEALRIDPRAVTEATWRALIDAHHHADAVSLALLAVLCARDPTGRAARSSGPVVPIRLLLAARRHAS